MKNNAKIGSLLALACAIASFSACDNGATLESAADGLRDSNKAPAASSSTTIEIEAVQGQACGETCYSITSGKDVGFIAIEPESCGGSVQLDLYVVDEADQRTLLDTEPVPHGQGKACPGIPASALKFDDLEAPHYELCLSADPATVALGAQLFVKSGQTCLSQSFAGDCDACGGPCSPEAHARFVGPVESMTLTPIYATTQSQVTELEVAADSLFLGGMLRSESFFGSSELQTGGAFLARLDLNAQAVWVARPTGSFVQVDELDADQEGNVVATLGDALFALDHDGNVLWTQPFYSWERLAVFDVDGSVFDVASMTPPDASAPLLKRDAAGAVSWTSSWAQGAAYGAHARPKRASTDDEGNLLLTAFYSGAVLIGGELLVTDASQIGSVAAKFAPDGTALWSRSVPGNERLTDIAADSEGNVVVVGRFFEPFDLGTGIQGSSGETRLAVAKYTSSGEPLWVQSWVVPAFNAYQRVAIDPFDNIVLAASVQRPSGETGQLSVDLGGGPLTLNGVGRSEYTELGLIIAKLDPCGQHLWSHLLDDSAPDQEGSIQVFPAGLDVDEAGNTWVVTTFAGAATFDGTQRIPASGNASDAILLEFGP